MISLIFDIDGTLVESEGFDGALYVEAVRRELGEVIFRRDWSEYRDVTDPGILRQVLVDNGLEVSDARIDKVQARFAGLVQAHLASNSCRAVSGALQTFEALRKAEGVALGIATGGWKRTAEMKLRSAGFDFDGIPLFAADHHPARVEILRACGEALGTESSQTLYVGDGVWDLTATTALGWGFVGIGEKLRGQGCIWLPDLEGELWPTAATRALGRARGA